MNSLERVNTLSKFDSVETALETLSKGHLIIVSDDEDRENEGDFVAIAELIRPETINFMITHGKGLVCMPIASNIAQRLQFHPMVDKNEEVMSTAFTVSVDAHPRHGVTTGISAWDRAKTVQLVVQDDTQPHDFVRPGHIFPLIAREGGIFTRTGHTEATTDLIRLAGYQPAGVIVEIINEDGTMARQPDLFRLRDQYHIPYITIADLYQYRSKYDRSPLVNV